MTNDTVFLRGLDVTTVIGVHDWEQRQPRRLLLDLELEFDTRRAGASDDLADALDYAQVARQVTQLAEASRFRLLEAFADAVCRTLFTQPGVACVRVAVHKPGAVKGVADVGVRVERRREDYTG